MKPEIIIKYGRLMDKAFNSNLHEPNKNPRYRTPEQTIEIVPRYVVEWNKYEDKILDSIQVILDLKFTKKNIDVYIVGAYPGAFSDPVTISSFCSHVVFTDVLAHELIHVILKNNQRLLKVMVILEKMFPNIKDDTILIHILIHSVLKGIYLNILESPERLETDIKRCGQRPSYLAAWNIVNEEGYKEIIQKFKSYYK